MKPLLGGVWKCQKWVENANQTQLKPIIWHTSWKLPKKWGNRPKKRKPINKLRISNFFWKPETDPKKEETDPKKRGNRSTNREFKTFSENRKLTPKKRGNRPQKTGNESNVNIAKIDPKYSEIPLHFLVFEGFPIILKKRRKQTQTHFRVRFRVEAFP